MSAVETLDELFEPLGQPGWADEVAADSRADDPRFVLSDDRMASWALRKVAKANAAIAAVKAEVAERKALLDDYQRRATASHLGTVEFMTFLLEDYHRRELDADPSRMTIVLPEGRIKSTTPRTPKVQFENQAAAVEWLEANGHRDVVKRTAKITDVRKLVKIVNGRVTTDDGDAVPGLVAELGDTTFTVDTDGGAS